MRYEDTKVGYIAICYRQQRLNKGQKMNFRLARKRLFQSRH